MAIEIKSPNSYKEHLKKFKIFLAGSIEQDTAKKWQERVISAFKNEEDVVLLNPRRDAWDATWKNVASNKKFREQVEWELDGLDIADAVIMYYDPATQSPISLLETGLHSDTLNGQGNQVLHVICPRGFWRKGNVDIVCERYEIPQFNSLKAACDAIKELIASERA